MTAFRSRNAYYLRISTNVVLPLFLYLDERHVTWMSDLVLQHVLADLRPLIIPKLQAEKGVHFGPGASTPGNKRGVVEVHRGETYQFAYFFRKTEPHTVLLKSRYFVTVPVRPGAAPKFASPRFADQNPQKKRSRAQASSRQDKRKRIKSSKGKSKISQSRLDNDEWSAADSVDEDDMDDADPVPGEPLTVRKQRHISADSHRDDNNYSESVDLDDGMNSPPLEMGDRSSNGPGVGRVDQPNPEPDAADIELVIEEEEEKRKPFLKLKYQSFSIAGHCLCVVVEPWPSSRAEDRLQSVGLGTPAQRGSSEPTLFPSNGSVVARQRAKTPLFFPEYDRAPSETPWARENILPPVPLFHDAASGTEHNSYNDDDLMNFSQTLNPAGHTHALIADDDDMDGVVLFGDADEIRELF